MKNLTIKFYLAVGVLSASIFLMTNNFKSIFLIVGIAMVLGVFFSMGVKILENSEKTNDKLLESENTENEK